MKPSGFNLPERLSRTSWEARILVGLSLVVVAVVFANRFGVLTPDTKPEIFLQPLQTAQRFAQPWLDTPNLGTPNYNIGNAPVAALFAPLDALGVPAWVAMRLWRIALLLIGAWGARLVMKDLLGSGASERFAAVAGIAAAVAYAANPYVVVGGGTTPTLQPYALLPWLVLVWLRGFRRPSWRSAVLGGLVLAGMGGINAGIVPMMQLLVIIPLVAHALIVERHRFGAVAWLLVRSGVVYVVLSAYWLVPAVGSLSAGIAVADATESVEAINMANSFPEVIRGLGMWTLYGIGGSGPFDPHRIGYVATPLVVLLSFGGPIIAGFGVRLSRSPARIFGATSVLVGALLMVGAFSTGQPSPWARLIEASVETVPGLVAFRTTNKFGAVLELGLAVLIGIGVAAISVRLATLAGRLLAVSLALAVTAASVAPALTGGLFWVSMDVPDYWDKAAKEVNARGGASRVLMVPGVGIPEYTWGYSGPDEIGPSLFTRPFAFRSASLSGGEYAAAMMAGVDRRLHNGTLPEGAVSGLAAYIRAGDVVGRYDLVGVDRRGQTIDGQLDADPGLGPASVFGADAEAQGAPGAVTLRPVTAATDGPSMRAASGQGALLIDGSGAALPGLTATGLTEGTPPILLAPAMTDEEVGRALSHGARVVITDSNARREWSSSHPTGVGPVLSEGETLTSTRAVFASEAQTTLDLRGNARVTTRGSGLLFGPYANGPVENAFDGDETTAWRFGNFGTGVGNAVVLVPDRARMMSRLSLSPLQGAGQWITRARVSATVNDRVVSREVSFTPWSSISTQVDLGPDPVSRLEIEITEVAGSGIGAVGFREIAVPGIRLERVLSVSDHLERRLTRAAALGDVAPDDIPIDVVLERDMGDAMTGADGEAGLHREFSLPDARTFAVSGTVRLSAAVSDSRIDALGGVAGPVSAESSSRFLNRPTARASMAVDASTIGRDLATAWLPDSPIVGEWIVVDFPEQRLESFTVTQPDIGPHITRVLVSVDDGEPFEVSLALGVTNVDLPEAADASRIRVLITEVSEPGIVQILDLGVPAVLRAPGSDPCRTLGWVGDRPIRAQIGAELDALLQGEAVRFTTCDGPLELGARVHRVVPASDFALDLLHLSGSGREVHQQPGIIAHKVVQSGTDSMTMVLPHGCTGCVVSTGQGFDPRWVAHLNGVDLGSPTVVDGYAAGWQVNAPPGASVTMAFGPRSKAHLAWWLSGLALVACLGIVIGLPSGGRPARAGRTLWGAER